MAGGNGGSQGWMMLSAVHKPLVIALLGAESTGKSTLAVQMATALAGRGYTVQVVSEYLREWCERKSRVPLAREQAMIAHAQSERIQLAATASIVIADTTALMTAVYSDYVFGDPSLYEDALLAQQSYDLTLLMGLDVPWVADGLQRDGPHVRVTVDGLIRQALQKVSIAATTIYGLGETRLEAALAIALQAIQPNTRTTQPIWKHFCECCGDGECERQLFGPIAKPRY